jgi:hypothetical protein
MAALSTKQESCLQGHGRRVHRETTGGSATAVTAPLALGCESGGREASNEAPASENPGRTEQTVAIEPEGASVKHIVSGASSGGVDDNPFRVMIDTVTNPDLSDPSCNEPPPEDASRDFKLTIFHWLIAPGSTYDIAAQGPIDYIDYVEDQRVRHTFIGGVPSRPNPDVAWAPAIRQGDAVYALPTERLNPDGQWRQVARCRLGADDLVPAGLDFENGEQLTFGYVRTVTNDIPDSELRVDHAIGSFQIVVKSSFSSPIL